MYKNVTPFHFHHKLEYISEIQSQNVEYFLNFCALYRDEFNSIRFPCQKIEKKEGKDKA